eukprot:TRINITY_DN3783_c0_g1_i1.p1 TRINITY_DN3783_c0_g1~~TRINITY_DN3783_c0_g1_i1.p1  ORF type:complete len:421 (-),score=91.50 TRINITY_DN3783_c0_g1_i1:111-1373(-)
MLRTIFAVSLLLLLSASVNAAVSPISSETFRDTLKSQEFVLVNFYAQWCPFSKKMAPIYSQASEELNSLAHFASVDVDADKHLTSLEHVAVVPTLKLFRNGAFVGSYQGKLEYESLKEWIQKMTVSFPSLESCASRAARMERKTLFVAFYKNSVNPTLSSAPVDSHSAALAAVAHAVGDKAAVFEHDEESRSLAAELGGSGHQNPAFALIDWVPRSEHEYSLRVRFFDDSSPYSLESLAAWASGCIEGKECRFVTSQPRSHVVVELSEANYESFVNDPDHDVIVAFSNKVSVSYFKDVLERTNVATGGVKTLRFAVVEVDEVPSAKKFMSTRLTPVVPSVWIFPAGENKSNPSISFLSLPPQNPEEFLARWAALKATHKFKPIHSDPSDKEVTHDESRASYWRRVLSILSYWLGAYWVEF